MPGKNVQTGIKKAFPLAEKGFGELYGDLFHCFFFINLAGLI